MKDTKVLIVIDMQNDFVYGALGTPQAASIVSNVVNKINRYNESNDLICYTQDIHDGSYSETIEGKTVPPHCAVLSEGSLIVPEVYQALEDAAATHRLVLKDTYGYNAWAENYPLVGWEPDIIELCGVCTDICVISNALILRSLYPKAVIVVDASCCAGVTVAKHRAALEVMKSCSINVINESE